MVEEAKSNQTKLQPVTAGARSRFLVGCKAIGLLNSGHELHFQTEDQVRFWQMLGVVSSYHLEHSCCHGSNPLSGRIEPRQTRASSACRLQRAAKERAEDSMSRERQSAEVDGEDSGGCNGRRIPDAAEWKKQNSGGGDLLGARHENNDGSVSEGSVDSLLGDPTWGVSTVRITNSPGEKLARDGVMRPPTPLQLVFSGCNGFSFVQKHKQGQSEKGENSGAHVGGDSTHLTQLRIPSRSRGVVDARVSLELQKTPPPSSVIPILPLPPPPH